MKRALALISLMLLVLALATVLVAQVFAAISQRAVTYHYLADALVPLPDRWSAVTWQAPEQPLARPFTAFDARLIGWTLTEAWQAIALSQATGDLAPLDHALSGVALRRARSAAQDAQAQGGRIAVLSLTARPVFFHLDGSVLQAEVEMTSIRYMTGPDGLIHHEITQDGGVATFMNETTGWRLFSWERRSSRPVKATPIGWKDGPHRGINYYPAATPWRAFWPGFDAQTIRADLRRVKGLNADSIRIFLPRDDFLDPSSPNLARLTAFLRLAEDEGISVIPTLFDLRGGYGPATWLADAEMLRRVLPILADSPAVSLVDLKNEPDLDFETQGRAEVEAWLLAMIATARDVAPGLPLTVGWATAEAAPILADHLDAVSYHDYAAPEGTASRLAAVKAAVAPRPVLVTEIGATAWTLALGRPGSPDRQARELGARLDALAGAEGVFVWALHDFDLAATAPVTASFWAARLQTGYGLFLRDGMEKPAAAVVRAAFAPAT